MGWTPAWIGFLAGTPRAGAGHLGRALITVFVRTLQSVLKRRTDAALECQITSRGRREKITATSSLMFVFFHL